MQGRLIFGRKQGQKNFGFVVPDPVWYKVAEDDWRIIELRPIKVWGLRNLNRAFHLDKVYVKFVDWIEWGSAGGKVINE